MITFDFEIVALLGAATYFVMVIQRTLAREYRAKVTARILVGLVLLGSSYTVVDRKQWNPDRLLGSPLAYTGLLHRLAWKEVPMPYFHAVANVEDGLAILVTFLGVFAACATIADPGPRQPHSVETFKARLAQLRTLLTASAITMIVAAVHVSAEYRWPAALLRDKIAISTSGDPTNLEVAGSVLAFASSVTLMFAGAFTLFMIAVFGTAFFVLDHKIQALAESRDEMPELTAAAWRRQVGLSVSWADVYGDIGKIIGPLVVAVLGTFIRF